MTSVLADQLSKTFYDAKAKTENRVIDGLSFTVDEGEFVAILGPSGCGKSTLLRLIAGLEGSTEGRIVIGGEDVTDRPAANRSLAMVFQNYALFPHLSVSENIQFGLKARKVDKNERQKRVREAAELLELDQLLDRKPAALSGGQRQRVALGRALVSGHNLVLMDEPLSNLDARLRAEMRRELRSLQQRLGLTVLYVTHDQVEAMTMADRVLVMREGNIEQYATPATLYREPASVSVARFVGSPPMNIIEPALGETFPRLSPETAGGDLILGIRPEDIEFTPSGDMVEFAEGIIAQQELLGADRLFFVDLDGEQTVTVRTKPTYDIPTGERVKLHASATAARWFDPDTGRALTSASQ